jgi:hypothetical protein
LGIFFSVERPSVSDKGICSMELVIVIVVVVDDDDDA